MQNAFENYKLPERKETPYYSWQQIALDCIEYLDKPDRNQVFRFAKLQESKLIASIRYMKERGIKNFGYLIKMMNTK